MARWRRLPEGKDPEGKDPEGKDPEGKDPEGKDAVPERRRHVRYAGDGLMVMIEGRMLPAADISLGGVRLADPGCAERGAVLALRLVPCAGESVLLGRAVQVAGQVLGTGRGGLRLAFVRPGYSLAKLVVRHARRQRLGPPFNPIGR